MQIRVHLKIIFWARIALILLVFILLLTILHLGFTLFVPLFSAFLVAILLSRMCSFFEKLRMGPHLAAVISVLLFLVAVTTVIFFINRQIFHFSKDLPFTEKKLADMLTNVQNWLAEKFHMNDEQKTTYFSQSGDDFFTSVRGLIGPTLLSTARLIILLFVFIFFTFFILVYRNLLRRFMVSLFKENQKEKANHIIITVRSLITSYVLGILSEMGIVCFLLFLILFVLGVKYALLMALVGAIINIIPYVGIYVAAALSMLITLAYGSDSKAVEVGIVFLIVHFIDANILIPFIVGKRVKINPFIAFVALITGQLVWGIPGLFLFIPLTAILKIIAENIEDLRPLAILIGDEK